MLSLGVTKRSETVTALEDLVFWVDRRCQNKLLS